MVVADATKQKQKAVYTLEGTLLEVCSCGVLCPCWVGEDPDGGECFSFLSHSFRQGLIDGIDVSGLSIVSVVHIPGNVLTPKSWKMALFVSDTWHRGLPAREGSTGRLFLQAHYARRDLAQRIRTTAEVNQLSQEAIERIASPRERTLLGLHTPYFYDG